MYDKDVPRGKTQIGNSNILLIVPNRYNIL